MGCTPRNLYGTYIQAVLETAITQASAYVRLERISSEAVALLPEGSGAVIHLRNSPNRIGEPGGAGAGPLSAE